MVGHQLLNPGIISVYGLEKGKVEANFLIIAVELSFFYDILHTKATVIHCRRSLVTRIASFVSVVMALFLFHISEKRGYESSDLIVTYILLSVALFLEAYSALQLVASKWTTISLLRLKKRWSSNLARLICSANNHIICQGNKGWWSGHMGQYGFVQYVLESDNESNWFKYAWDLLFRGEKSVEVSDILEKTLIKHVENLFEATMSLGDFEELLRKIRSSWITNTLDRYHLDEMKDEMKAKTFDECVIAWHLATEICLLASNNVPVDSEEGLMRKNMYMVSTYMTYLLLKRSSMMPPGIPRIRMAKTLSHFNFTFGECGLNYLQVHGIVYNGDIKNVPNDWREKEENGISHSAFPLACRLVRQLRRVAETSCQQRQWEVIRDAWMEMLTYAAVRCSRTEHWRGLSRGGELLTHYWLLLAHYGILEDYNASRFYSDILARSA